MPTHPQFVPTSLPPAGTTGLFLLSGDAQVSCQIEGNSQDLCINDMAAIQIATLDSRLRGNDKHTLFLVLTEPGRFSGRGKF